MLVRLRQPARPTALPTPVQWRDAGGLPYGYPPRSLSPCLPRRMTADSRRLHPGQRV